MTERKENEVICHNLKIYPEYYEAIEDGLKRAEIRVNDRDYRVGDFMLLRCFDPVKEEYTKDEPIMTRITHMEKFYGMPGFFVLSFRRLV